MMKSWIIESYDRGFSGLKKIETPIPEPKDKQILVKVSSVSLNYRDYSILFNEYRSKLPEGLVPCSDICGYVYKIGPGVTKFKINDRVVNLYISRWLKGVPSQDDFKYTFGGPLNGGLTEYILIEEESCLLAPSYLNDNQCSTLPIAALTAWYSLITTGNLKKDQFVLIEGTGGVSIFALQISHALGAKPIVLTSDDEKMERVKKLGALHCINYKNDKNWDKTVLELTNGVGVDHIVEVVGGENLNLAIRSSKQQAHIYSIGFLKSPKVEINVFDLVVKRINIHGIGVGDKESMELMINRFKDLDIIPVIDSVYCFDDAIKAFQHLKKGSFGKIVIEVNNKLKTNNPSN